MTDINELLAQLNITDECVNIEAKRASEIDKSVMETINAFSNEPNLGGGYLLLGVEQDEKTDMPQYIVTGISDPDKLQLDLSSQCADSFNQTIRPEIKVETIGDKNVIVVFVPELPASQKPVYFKNIGLPRGAYRRIGSSDQRCSDDDMFIFYHQEDKLDSSIIEDSGLDDISEEAIALYRNLRTKVNPYAEELQYDNIELLQSLTCLKKVADQYCLTYAGLLLFGKRTSLRRLLPMVRVDYIRVPGNIWIEDPDNRFTTVDMRGSMLEMVQRAFSLVSDDLPKGFLLPEGELQAESIGLPARVLREAIVNSMIHRTFRVNQPIQIIRYGNRIEISNPGYSLKPEDRLGIPGSVTRNPIIATIFHETNLAETKGSGIRTMRTLMEKAQMLPPTFESNHALNQFTIRLLLHHFLGEEDVNWLSKFGKFNLNEDQKRSLIFTKEVGAVDNLTYRQLNGIEILKATTDLRELKNKGILEQKGRGKATYYVPGEELIKLLPLVEDTVQVNDDTVQVNDDSEQAKSLSEQVKGVSEQVRDDLVNQLPPELANELPNFTGRVNNTSDLANFICRLCAVNSYSLSQLSLLLHKRERYLLTKFVKPLRESGYLAFTIPEMQNHPKQAYYTLKK
ncbi:MAG: putative DNA binding domain-containing protein [Candidatus Symbiothrix sp.]|jgi:ATP-dependent DNA helicase RecG|nr:putative DNA binding domain-containing protein [Candidatus Symbiothrix sp.]